MRGIKRTRGCAQREAKPLLRDDLLLVLDAMGVGLKATRDRALLLIDFAGGLRRSELVGSTWATSSACGKASCCTCGDPRRTRTVWKIRQQTGHASDAMLSRYIRDGELFADNAAGALL
jgi:site-specific recombinase XerC